jgi:hypothetical protein
VVGTVLPEPGAWDAFRTRLWVAPADDDTASGDVADGASGEQDVVDLLTDQHRQIERLFQRVLQSEGDDRHAAFGELARPATHHRRLRGQSPPAADRMYLLHWRGSAPL